MREMTERFDVWVTGWMQDERFEDYTVVEAVDEEAAFDIAKAALENRWGHSLEVGDMQAYRVDR